MRHRHHLLRGMVTALLLTVCAASAAAQTGRVGGMVKDDTGQPIKGATVTAENPNASPSSFTATTDDKGRFSIIGLRTGQWSFTAQAPGFGAERGQMRVQTIGQTAKPSLREYPRVSSPVGSALRSRRQAFFGGRFQDTPVYDGEKIGQGHRIEGPAIIEERFTTIVIYPGQTAELDRFGNYRIALPATTQG